MNTIDSQYWLLFRVSSQKVLKRIRAGECDTQMQQLVQHLLDSDDIFAKVFGYQPEKLEQKIIKTLKFLNNLKKVSQLDKAIESISAVHTFYADINTLNFLLFKNSLTDFAADVLADEFTHTFADAWHQVLDAVIHRLLDHTQPEDSNKTELDSAFIDAIGGRSTIEAVHQGMYDLLFEDDWLGQFFQTKNKQTLIRKQTDFVLSSAGIEVAQVHESPYTMHMHMYISQEMYDIRQHYLQTAMQQQQLSEEHIQRWLAYDNAFRDAIQKQSVDECVTRCPGQRPIVPHKPRHYQIRK